MPTRSDSDSIKSLVDQFASNVGELRTPQTKEATLRVQYLDRFFKLLGWDVSNEAGVPYDEQDVIIEKSIDVAEKDKLRARRPDYLFRVAGLNQLTCEAKKPAVDLDRDKDAIFQAKRDAYSLGLPFTILTDFEQFRVYDTGYQPDIDSPTHGMVKDFSLSYGDYPAQWDVLLATFGREAVAGGSLDRLRAGVRKTRAGQRIRGIDRTLFELRGDKPAGDAFLAQLQSQRLHVAADLYKHNRSSFPDIDTPRGAARLAEFTQRWIDRVVFCRICEDRGVENYGALRDLVEESLANDRSLRVLLVRHFRQYDKDFNGYLFKPHGVESCDFTAAVLRDLIAQFYPPASTANFAVLPDDLLATVYERFLGSTISVSKGKVEIEEKPEVRHAGGVYYTPRFVVESILRRVIAPKLVGKKPLELLGGNLTILDPACGSGSFLIAALGLLIDHCEQAITDNPKLAVEPVPGSKKKRPIAFQKDVTLATSAAGQTIKSEKVWRLTPDFKGRLLTDCVYGIDIDQQAVEVTIMSLYAKVLSDLPPDWRGISENRILPALDNNIRCGNSLIDQDRLDRYAEEKHGGLFSGDDNVRFRINAFDWHSQTRGFGRVLGDAADATGGFDCVIGNPPYIRVQELNQWAPEECAFYKWQYASAAKGNYDIYVAFTERVLTGGHDARGLLKPDGAMGFIMPHKWWQAAYGAGLRKIVADGKFLRSVIDFGHQLVFRDASVYTAIQVFKGSPQTDRIDFAKIEELIDGPIQLTEIDAETATDGAAVFHVDQPKTDAAWEFLSASARDLMTAIELATTTTLADVAERMAQGLRTSCNDVFVLRIEDAKRGRYLSQQLGRTVELEPTFIQRFLSADAMRRFEIVTPDKVVLIPYALNSEGGMRLVTSDTLRKTTPKTWEYLKSVETTLREREDGKMDVDGWYGYVYPKNLTIMSAPKLLVPDIVNSGSFSIDAGGDFAFVSGYGITLKPQHAERAHFVLGLLNSTLLSDYLKNISTPLRGGWFRTFPQFMGRLPIKIPTTPVEKKLAERIESSVRQIMTDKAALASGQLIGDRDRNDAESRIDTAQRRIDADVMALYGVDRLPG